MITKKDLFNTFRCLENKINKLESELFNMKFPDGKINITNTYKCRDNCCVPSYPFSFLTYSYGTENRVETIDVLQLRNSSDFKEVNIKKNDHQIFFKIELDKTHYLLLNKETKEITRLPEEMFLVKNEWIKLDIMK